MLLSLLDAAERWLDGRLQDERFAARWHLGIVIGVAVSATGSLLYHAWATCRHRRAHRYFTPSPCRHVPPR